MPTSRQNLASQRWRLLGLLLTAWLCLAACTTDDGVAPDLGGTRPDAKASATPEPTATPTTTPSASPSASPTPTPSPSPTVQPITGGTEVTSPDPNATPTPTPTPRATPVTASVSAVLVSPGQATINLPAGPGAQVGANFPTTVQLEALVRFSDNSIGTGVGWSAGSGIVTVSKDGLVTAVSVGTVSVTAISQQDPSKSGSCVITVERNGMLDLVID